MRELDTDAFRAAHTRPSGPGGRTVELALDGVHCAACVWLVERLPYEVEGVRAARLDLPRARLRLTYDAGLKLSGVADWLGRFGYAARPLRTDGGAARPEAERALLVRMGVAWALAGNIMLIAFALYAGLETAAETGLATAARWISLALAVPALGYGAAPFFRRAAGGLKAAVRARSPRYLPMDLPIALGLAVGFGHSAWATVAGQGAVWFDSIAVLVAALLTARYVQLRSRRVAGEAGERLLALVPSMALKARGGASEPVRVDTLRAGDLVEVPPGDVVPVDGRVTSGTSRLDNAVLTGESAPQPVAPGDAVLAGASNLSAGLLVRVEGVGEGTRVGRLLAWVRSAEGGAAPVVLLADRLAGWFVAGVIVLAAVTAALWLALDPAAAPRHVAALLVITCPCALGMATPLAMAVAASRAARGGVYIKSDEATQRLTEIDTVVLDKTGTLTHGAFSVAGFAGDPAVRPLVAALERGVPHPIAQALAGEEPAEALRAERVRLEGGQGVEGTVAGRVLKTGRPAWCAAEAGPPQPEIAAFLEHAAREGHTPVGVVRDGAWAGAYALGDTLRPEAAALVRRFRDAGRSVWVLSGDSPAAVRAALAPLDLDPDRVRGGVSPEAKRDAVQALRRQGRAVLFVGDGVNDIGALHAADVGVAVGGGATASLVAADVFVTRPGLAPLAALLTSAEGALKAIRRALGVSLVYNLAGAGAALAGWVTPLGAAVAMPLSSLLVIAIALGQPQPFRDAS